MKVTVRWESAQPMFDGTKRERAQESTTHYIVSVTGLRLGGMMGGGRPGMGGPGGPGSGGPGGPGGARSDRKGKGGDEGGAPEERRSAIFDRMKENTTLERKGKDAIHPDRIQPVQTNQGMITVFMFPRTGQPIVLDDKEVTLHQKMGPMDWKAKFALKDMVYNGKLEL